MPPRGGGPPEPVWLEEADLLAIHAQQIERYGGSHGVLEKNAVLSGVARDTNGNRGDIPRLAATYLAGLTRTRGFTDGNRRTGLASAIVFLGLNGWSLEARPEQLYAITMAVANGEAGDETVAEFVRRHASKSSR